MTKHASNFVLRKKMQVFWGNGGVCPDGICPLVALKKLVFPQQRKLTWALVQVQRGFRRRFQEPLVQSQVGFNGFRRRLQRRSRRRFWESLVQGKVRFNRFNRVSSAWLRSTLQKDV